MAFDVEVSGELKVDWLGFWLWEMRAPNYEEVVGSPSCEERTLFITPGQAIIYAVYAQLAPQVRCHTAHVRKNTNFSLKYCVAVADFFVSVPYPFDWSFASLPQNQISSLSKKKKNQISSQPKQARPLIIVWNYGRQYSFKR